MTLRSADSLSALFFSGGGIFKTGRLSAEDRETATG
jgi:hypothetical protein